MFSGQLMRWPIFGPRKGGIIWVRSFIVVVSLWGFFCYHLHILLNLCFPFPGMRGFGQNISKRDTTMVGRAWHV